MNQQQRDYELEMARETDPEQHTDVQRSLVKRADISAGLDQERQTAIKERRAAGIDDRLITSYNLYQGERDSNGLDTFDGVTKPAVGSKAYANITRQITNDGAAQIGDLLFPNDDRNYGLKPVPLTKPPLALQDAPAVDSNEKPILDAEGKQLTNIQAHTRRTQRVRVKTDRMFSKVDSSLIKAKYPSKARKVILAGAVYGTGIVKGPLPMKERKGRWAKTKDGVYALRKGGPIRPDAKVVSPLDWYPDMSATLIEDCRYFWERMPMQPADLERAVDEFGYDREAVSRVLVGGVRIHSVDSEDPTNEARPTTGLEGRAAGRHLVWERHGTLSRDQLDALDVKPKNGDQYHNAVVTLCNGEILKAVLVPYESDEPLYSAYSWDEDPMSLFGYGVPWLMQDQQKAYVAAWRMALDNGGLSAAPQILIDRTAVTPVNGEWKIHGGKEWYIKGDSFSHDGAKSAFQVVEIKENLEFIFVMMDRAISDAYEMTGVTRVDNAQTGLDNSPVTLGATQIVQNNTSVSRRAQARRWDDRITLTLITRFYDFFMQFEDDDDIKANMEVEPRGATVLLAKELTATNTIQLYQMTSGGAAEGAKGVDILRGLEASMQIPAGTYVETPDETEARQAKEKEAGDQVDPEVEFRNREIEVSEAEVELKMGREQLEALKASQKYEIDMIKLQLEEAKAMADLDDKQQARQDSFHSAMEEARERHSKEIQTFIQDQATKRDIAAAKIGADRGVKGRMADLKERELILNEREMTHKETTGEPGI